MGSEVTLTLGGIELGAALNDSPIAAALLSKLPLEVALNRWGDEYYGAIGLDMENDDETRETVAVGTLAYWPTGDAFCIFFGPTPMSSGSEPRAASAVSVIGSVTAGDPVLLRSLGPRVTATIRLS